MNLRLHKRSALLAFTLLLLLLGVSLACFVWVRKKQAQYVLDRALIEALKKSETKQALALLNAGADPNTYYTPSPQPSLQELCKQWLHYVLHPAPKSVDPQDPNEMSAIQMAYGKVWFK